MYKLMFAGMSKKDVWKMLPDELEQAIIALNELERKNV